MSSHAHEGDRAHRYRVTESGGCLADQCPPGTYLLEWEDRGRETDWNVWSHATRGMVGFAIGVLVDRGYIRDGKYVSDRKARRLAAKESGS